MIQTTPTTKKQENNLQLSLIQIFIYNYVEKNMFPFIQILINKGYISPSFARLIEYSIISGLVYLATVYTTNGETFDSKALIVSILVPVFGYLSKLQRDLASDSASVSAPVQTAPVTPEAIAPNATVAQTTVSNDA